MCIRDSLKRDRKNSKVHLELAAMTDLNLYEQLVKNGLQNADSIGLNEQETGSLIKYLSTGELQERESSRLNINHIFQDIVDLIKLFRIRNIPVSRIHLHTLNTQVICSTSKWGDQRVSLAKAMLLAVRLACGHYNLNATKLVLDAPQTYLLPHLNGVVETRAFDPSRPIVQWNPTEEFTCFGAPQFYVRRPVRTQGLGDNISSVGLVYSSSKAQFTK
eukprot:TRINITY_DN6893_c0_g1_i1.p1 TRINITY_DN6893_c0_g1~~TRINITY_DN6893_c0_g1_i1.p1  ORF type:complete len:218 (+),score=40.38 TRINITY_DN6893_c0_g1_i1:65-718(+)